MSGGIDTWGVGGTRPKLLAHQDQRPDDGLCWDDNQRGKYDLPALGTLRHLAKGGDEESMMTKHREKVTKLREKRERPE